MRTYSTWFRLTWQGKDMARALDLHGKEKDAIMGDVSKLI